MQLTNSPKLQNNSDYVYCYNSHSTIGPSKNNNMTQVNSKFTQSITHLR